MQPPCNWLRRGSSREACRAPSSRHRLRIGRPCDIPVAARQLLVTPAPYSDHVWWKWEVLDYLAIADAIEGKRRTMSGWPRLWAIPPRSRWRKLARFFHERQPCSNVQKKAPHTRASAGAIMRGWLGAAISHVLICSEWPKGTGNYSNRGDKVT